MGVQAKIGADHMNLAREFQGARAPGASRQTKQGIDVNRLSQFAQNAGAQRFEHRVAPYAGGRGTYRGVHYTNLDQLEQMQKDPNPARWGPMTPEATEVPGQSKVPAQPMPWSPNVATSGQGQLPAGINWGNLRTFLATPAGADLLNRVKTALAAAGGGPA
jgi:hypothetical protein